MGDKVVNELDVYGDGDVELDMDNDAVEEKDEVVGADPSSEDSESGEEGPAPKRTSRGKLREKEEAKLAKVMAKRAPPAQFFGATEAEKEGVEQWVRDANGYLDSQFGRLAHAYPRERLELISSYIKGTAAIWLSAARETDPSQTWETLQKPFVEFIRGGRESRTLWLEKLKTLVYGRGKCKDLLGLEQEFESLRVKLYPTSSTDPTVNEIVGREYAEAIRRGNVPLFTEMLRMLGGKEQVITLSQWKTAAVKALQIITLTAAASSGQRQGGNGGSQSQRWTQGNRYGSQAAVQEMNTDGPGDQEEGVDKGDTQPGEGAEAQQMQGRRTSSEGFRRGPPRPRGMYLPPEEWRVVVDKDLCKQCYKAGHHIGDPSCPEKGKPRRRPTQAELKA